MGHLLQYTNALPLGKIRAPTLTRPRKRERGRAVRAARRFPNLTNTRKQKGDLTAALSIRYPLFA